MPAAAAAVLMESPEVVTLDPSDLATIAGTAAAKQAETVGTLTHMSTMLHRETLQRLDSMPDSIRDVLHHLVRHTDLQSIRDDIGSIRDLQSQHLEMWNRHCEFVRSLLKETAIIRAVVQSNSAKAGSVIDRVDALAEVTDDHFKRLSPPGSRSSPIDLDGDDDDNDDNVALGKRPMSPAYSPTSPAWSPKRAKYQA
jgi:hypothetical protein